ncbi:DUF6538 domain-containing protein [Chthonobacter rhizosphaerae]|uniref:DUF6538 domain-containing protein n=1 Tax=Chthonobacter rhizosphaerae TaxID=2735553 RepID=UPI0015EEFC99|nr:DUF6538 domain-containing protein [Chthonobacter rhizosphaerae]
MAGKVRNIRERNGLFFARLVVPAALRPIIGQTDLIESLGSNRTAAERRSYEVLTRFQARLADARAKLGKPDAPVRTKPLAPEALAIGRKRELTDKDTANLATLRDVLLKLEARLLKIRRVQQPSSGNLFYESYTHTRQIKCWRKPSAGEDALAIAAGACCSDFGRKQPIRPLNEARCNTNSTSLLSSRPWSSPS